jgi:hypothetical protein
MRIRSHSESHLVELDDGSRWQVFPGDLHLTLGWQPDTELSVIEIEGNVCSHALVSTTDNSQVRVIPAGRPWPVGFVQSDLKNG